MDGKRRCPGILHHPRKGPGVALLLVPAGAHLDRHRDAHGLRHRTNDGGGMLGLAHQAATGVVLRDLGDGASHVDVDDVGAELLDDGAAVGHLLGVAPEDLNRDRPLFLGVLRVFQRAIDAADQALRADHLGDDEAAAAVALHQAAERRVGHARHGRDRKR